MCDNSAFTEEVFTQRLTELFRLVDAREPQKGIEALLKRAHQRVVDEGMSLSEALVAEYQAAKLRTNCRLAFLSQCQVNDSRD